MRPDLALSQDPMQLGTAQCDQLHRHACARASAAAHRDREFERKMVEVLHVYKEVEMVSAGLLKGTLKEPAGSLSYKWSR
jgi:hypothetical protein